MSDRPDMCKRGHAAWVITNPITGARRCRKCRDLRNAQRTGGVRIKAWADKNANSRGAREDTFTYSEIMRVRGYVV